MLIRSYRPSDRDAVLALNNAAVPAVSELDEAVLDQLVGWAESVSVVAAPDDDHDIVAFLVCLSGPGLPYTSDNYAWLSRRYPSFLYVDRVVVRPGGKGAGVGQALYHRIVAAGRHRFPVLVAEVNTRPRNEASLRFHERFGFRPVGRAQTDAGAKEVLYLELSLAPPDGGG